MRRQMAGGRFVMVALTAVIAASGSAWAICDTAEDRQAVAETRALADVECECASFTRLGDYKTCVRRVVTEQLLAGNLPLQCKSVVMRCAARSTCGRRSGQAVACCRTDYRGFRSCRIQSLPSQCVTTAGGTACVSSATSCCDACQPGFGCTPSTTTTTTPG
jgi:hypothetical protein